MQAQIASPHMLAVGLQNGGHNPNYLQWLAEGWAARPAAGRLTLLVSADFAARHPATAHTIAALDPARIVLLPLTPQEQTRQQAAPPGLLALPAIQPHTARRVQRWREWQTCRRIAAQIGADHALFINLDFYQSAATWNPEFPCPISGVFHNLMLHYPQTFATHLTRKQRATALLQTWSMRRFLARARAATLFCLDPYVVELLNGRPGRHRAVHLPTPARSLQPTAASGARDELRRRHAIDPARRVFLMLGGIGPRRGIYPVLDALARLDPAAARQVCLLLVGRQSDRLRLAQALATTAAAAPVQIVARDEFIAESEIGSYYALADAVLATHVNHVGSSESLAKAAAAGKPVIAAEFGLLGAFTQHNGLGLTVDSHDADAIAAAFRAMLAAPPDHFVNRAKAQQFAQTHSVDAFVEVLIAHVRTPI
ncbi:MAG: glycosyltransferase [Caldilineaceae bacterium]|nr:glycosyltransferase [Caldilineaceae bacterium]